MKFDDFRFRPARAGFAQRRKELLTQLRVDETCVFHSTIMCSGPNPPKEWLDKKAAFEADVAKAVAELEQICRPVDVNKQAKMDARRMK